MQPRHLLLVALIALVGCTTAQIRGVVYVDRNGDGKRQKDEPGVGGVVVAVDRAVFATTDASGTYDFEAPIDEGRVWVRVPDGFRPGPAWKEWHGSAGVDLPIVPLTQVQLGAPLTFVVAADSHTPKTNGDWDGGDLEDAIAQAVALPVPPRFFTILGDITAGNDDLEFERVTAALQRAAGVPWVPVAGNHDWYDMGGAYRRHYGLDSYSFDIGRVHFVVWDTNAEIDDQIAFLAQDLAHVTGDMTIVALAHSSPLDVVADQMEALGVDYLFTAHWHANRRLQRGKMVEWSTQPFVMGGIDQSASGYRVVTFVDGEPVVRTRERMVAPHAELVWPHAGSCATASSVIAAVSLDAADPDVSMRVDCGPKVELNASGGWSFGAVLPKLAPGTHSIVLDAHSVSGRAIEKQIPFAVCEAATSGSEGTAMTSWLQLGGTAAHDSARAEPVTPPLVVRWATNVGGTLSLGTPVVANGLALVAITDGGAGDGGGLVALDLATGVEKWRYRTASPAVGAPAIAMGVTGMAIARPPPIDVVIVATKNGEIDGLRLSDGAHLWRYNAAAHLSTFASANWAAPVVSDGVVYVALQGNFVALDAATGLVNWMDDPADPEFHWLGTLAAPAVADGRVVAAFNRTLGLWSAKAASGEVQWKVNDSHTLAVNSSPVISDGVAYVLSAHGIVSAIRLHETDVAYGATPGEKEKPSDARDERPVYAWSTIAIPGATDWHYVVTTTPALAHDTLVISSQWSDLIALDAKNGAVKWRAQAAKGPLNFAHYKSAQAGWAASPVITGDLVWIGGLDGRLIAYALETGALVWQTQLGAPIASAVAPTGSSLVVASYDGTVRLMMPGVPPVVSAVAVCPPLPPPPPPTQAAKDSGCAAARAPTGPSAIGSLVLVVLAISRSMKRRACRRSRLIL